MCPGADISGLFGRSLWDVTVGMLKSKCTVKTTDVVNVLFFFFFLLLNPFHVLVLIIFLFVKMVGCQKLGFSPRLLPSCTCLCSGLLFCHHCWWKSLWCDSGRSTHRWGHLVTFSHIFRLSCSPSDRSELLLIISLNGLFSSWTVGGALSSHYC